MGRVFQSGKEFNSIVGIVIGFITDIGFEAFHHCTSADHAMDELISQLSVAFHPRTKSKTTCCQ